MYVFPLAVHLNWLLLIIWLSNNLLSHILYIYCILSLWWLCFRCSVSFLYCMYVYVFAAKFLFWVVASLALITLLIRRFAFVISSESHHLFYIYYLRIYLIRNSSFVFFICRLPQFPLNVRFFISMTVRSKWSLLTNQIIMSSMV